MGWFSKIKDGIKNIFNKVSTVVKSVVKGIGKVGKKIWGGVKKITGKFGKAFTKLGPLANIAMSFIPGFGQLWKAYGIWGSMAKGAITGYLGSGGNVKGALLGAAGSVAGDWYQKLPGNGISEKIGNVLNFSEGTDNFVKSFTDLYNPVDTGIKGYTGRVGADTSNLPPSQRKLYANSAPSPASIKSAYDSNMATGRYTSAEALEKLNAQGARDAAYWKNQIPKLPNLLSSAVGGVGAPYQDTSPTNSYALNAGQIGGHVGTGYDTYDVKKLGLLDKRRLIQDAERQFLTA